MNGLRTWVSSIFILVGEALRLGARMRLFSARPASLPPPPPAPIIVALAKDARLARWRSLTLDGNVAFEQGEVVRARQLFEEALAVADRMMADVSLPNDDPYTVDLAPLLHGIACSNIAELARHQGDRETAGIYLYRRASCLISVIESSRAPLELRSRCLLHLRVASGGLYEYFEQTGMWDAAAGFSARTNAAMFMLQRLSAEGGGAPASPDPFVDDAFASEATPEGPFAPHGDFTPGGAFTPDGPFTPDGVFPPDGLDPDTRLI